MQLIHVAVYFTRNDMEYQYKALRKLLISFILDTWTMLQASR